MKGRQKPDRRCVRVDGRRTAINVEQVFWDRFRIIAAKRGMTMSRLLGEINRSGWLEILPDGRRWVRALKFSRAHLRLRARAASAVDVNTLRGCRCPPTWWSMARDERGSQAVRWRVNAGSIGQRARFTLCRKS
jgi:predicted DNA-binding ribbon-helix-helix protein